MSEPKIAALKPDVRQLEPGTYFWCACGNSASQPFCDGSHKGTGMGPMKFDLAEAKQVALCNCKHAGTKPFCDGTHKRL